MSIFNNRNQMWFGTEEKMGWIETPQTGADVSPEGFGASATLQNGGGYERNSWGAHKVHQFSWGDAATRGLASKIHAYRNGTYGRGLIHFIDPMYYDTNILPKHWADPSMAINFEAPPLIAGATPSFTPTVANVNDLPTRTTIYSVPSGYSAEETGDELFIPIPAGATLALGAIWDGTNAQVYARTTAGITPLTKVSATGPSIAPDMFSGVPWVRLGIRATGATSDLTIVAMSARILPDTSPSTLAWTETRRNLFLNPDVVSTAEFGATAGQSTLSYGSSAVRWTSTVNGTAIGIDLNADWATTNSDYRVLVRARANKNVNVRVRIRSTEPSTEYTVGTNWDWIDVIRTSGTGTGTSGLVIRGTTHVIGDWVEIDRVLIAASTDVGPHFSGASTALTVDERYLWAGPPDASQSVFDTRAAGAGEVALGPWVSGEGNTGCQFRGSPTLVNYNGINGGQIGLACTLVETGAWQ